MAGSPPLLPKRRGRVWRTVERGLLGAGMTVVAFFIERRLLRAIKKGGIEAAPRTAAESDEYAGEPLPNVPTGEITTQAQG